MNPRPLFITALAGASLALIGILAGTGGSPRPAQAMGASPVAAVRDSHALDRLPAGMLPESLLADPATRARLLDHLTQAGGAAGSEARRP